MGSAAVARAGPPPPPSPLAQVAGPPPPGAEVIGVSSSEVTVIESVEVTYSKESKEFIQQEGNSSGSAASPNFNFWAEGEEGEEEEEDDFEDPEYIVPEVEAEERNAVAGGERALEDADAFYEGGDVVAPTEEEVMVDDAAPFGKKFRPRVEEQVLGVEEAEKVDATIKDVVGQEGGVGQEAGPAPWEALYVEVSDEDVDEELQDVPRARSSVQWDFPFVTEEPEVNNASQELEMQTSMKTFNKSSNKPLRLEAPDITVLPSSTVLEPPGVHAPASSSMIVPPQIHTHDDPDAQARMTAPQAAMLNILKKKMGSSRLKNSALYPGGPSAKHVHHIYFYGHKDKSALSKRDSRVQPSRVVSLGTWDGMVEKPGPDPIDPETGKPCPSMRKEVKHHVDDNGLAEVNFCDPRGGIVSGVMISIRGGAFIISSQGRLIYVLVVCFWGSTRRTS